MTQGDSQWHSFTAADGNAIHYRYWPVASAPRALIQIIHGAAEHSGRYEAFARHLVAAGYAVYASDHRGHGRTRVRSGALGDAGPDAWNRFVDDEQQLSRIARAAHVHTPLVVLGHSLGSFIAQDYITRDAQGIDGLILSGTAYAPPPSAAFIEALDEHAERQPLGASEVWAGLFANFNKSFSDRPGFDWLSRDPAVVAAYEQDPLAGFVFSNALVRDYVKGMVAARDPAREARISRDLPVLVIQGARDPVGAELAQTRALLERYETLGMTRLSHVFYPDARHEVLNETNRDEVEADVLHWLERTFV